MQDITINDDGGSILGSYGNHKTVTAEPAVLSYYAGWQAAMTYDLDGGTLNGAQNGFSETKHNGQGYTVQAEPQKEGYRFLGWKARRVGTAKPPDRRSAGCGNFLRQRL